MVVSLTEKRDSQWEAGQADIISTLERWLDRAKAGDVHSLAIASSGIDGASQELCLYRGRLELFASLEISRHRLATLLHEDSEPG